MADDGEAPEQQRRLVARLLVVLAVVWSAVAVARGLDEDTATLDRWFWALLALGALAGGVEGARAIRRERGRGDESRPDGWS